MSAAIDEGAGHRRRRLRRAASGAARLLECRHEVAAGCRPGGSAGRLVAGGRGSATSSRCRSRSSTAESVARRCEWGPERSSTWPRWPPSREARLRSRRRPGTSTPAARRGSRRRRRAANRRALTRCCWSSRPARCTAPGRGGAAARDRRAHCRSVALRREQGGRRDRPRSRPGDAPACRVIVARPFPHTGPGQTPNFVLPAFAERLRAAQRSGGRTVPTGNLEPVRDFLDVRDVVAAYRLLLTRGVPGEAYNVAAGHGRPARGACSARLRGDDRRGGGAGPDPALIRGDRHPASGGRFDEAPARHGLGAGDLLRTDTSGTGRCPSGLTSRPSSSSAPARSSSGRAPSSTTPGTQAVRALKEEGYRVVLVNSNPATIMTDPELADRTYIEPVTPEWVAKVIERERPDALLPTMGGQTALNVAMALQQRRHAGEVRRRADRRQRARHPAGRGPAGVRRGDAADRARHAGGAHGAEPRGGARGGRAPPAIPRSSARRSPWAAPAAASPTTARSSRR